MPIVVVVAYLEETFPKYAKKSLKSSFGDSNIEPGSLQNRVLSPPRGSFQKTLNLRILKKAPRNLTNRF